MPDQHTCKNCGAIENLKTGELTYKGDNPLLKENKALKEAVTTLEVKNKYLAKLAAGKRAKKEPGTQPAAQARKEPENAKEKENPWHY
ncbi:MAG: hypothetical protein KKH77_07025 [Candidatus Omnitrophica bacterium]|nr:hypothetical protein [Candidatus Omnitrophota bacterium]MBU1808131.1 hypothetical protein [Candidatus Omnitrophota bacterium]